MSVQVEGIIPAAVTPFDRNSEINEPALRDLLLYLAGSGVHGIFVLGSQGEFYALSFQEKVRLMEVAVETVGSALPIYAGTGTNTTRETIKLSRAAQKAGIDAVSVITPSFISPSQQELYLALQQGVVDGQENPLQQITSMKFYEVQKYLILTGHAQNPEILIINEDKYASLPGSYQKVLLDSGEVYGDTCRRLFKEEEAVLLARVKEAGMTVIEPNLDMRSVMRSRMCPRSSRVNGAPVCTRDFKKPKDRGLASSLRLCMAGAALRCSRNKNNHRNAIRIKRKENEVIDSMARSCVFQTAG